MTITPISGILIPAPVQKLSGSASASVSSSSDVSPAVKSQNASSVSILPGAIKLLASSGLYEASQGLAQLNGQASTASGSTQQIISILQSLRSIAQQVAGSGVNDASLSSLESQFQSLYLQIDQIASNSTFGGKKLLNGSFSIDSAAVSSDGTSSSDTGFAVPNLSLKGLFGNSPPSVATPQSAANALPFIDNAFNVAENTYTGLQNIGSQFSAAAAAFQSAQSNQFAAASQLTDSDITGSGFVSLFSTLTGKPGASASAQTSKFSANIAKLLAL